MLSPAPSSLSSSDPFVSSVHRLNQLPSSAPISAKAWTPFQTLPALPSAHVDEYLTKDSGAGCLLELVFAFALQTRDNKLK